MRHFYKSHGKHCYLRSFQTSCRKCGADVLYWECTHGSKIFFEYPPYGKLRRHYCRKLNGLSHKRKIYPVVVKKPKGLLENPYFSCPVCGKLFKKEIYLKDHLNELKKNDSKHKLFFQNKIMFKNKFNDDMNKLKSEKNKFQDKPRFGRINIRASKK